MSVLILAEHKGGVLGKGALVTISGGKAVAEAHGLPFDIALIGSGLGAAADKAKKLGARTVYVADDAKFANYMDELWSATAAQIAEQAGATIAVGGATSQGRSVLGRLAGQWQAGMASDIIGVAGPGQFKRPIFAGNLIATVQINTDKKVVTIRGTAYEPAAETGADSAVVAVTPSVDPAGLRKTFVSFDAVLSSRPALTEAGTVVSFGRGVKEAENIKIIEKLADVLGGAVGATRAVVDAGWYHNDYQVGQTGKTVAPNLYVAVGLSGAIQHLAGMKDSKVIVAINKDEEAQIFSVADYGLVDDLFNVVPELTEKIQAIKGA